jgi:hypothetical protein
MATLFGDYPEDWGARDGIKKCCDHPKNPSRNEVLFHFSSQINFLRLRVLIPTYNPQTGGPPLAVCPLLLIQYIRSYPLHSWRQFLHPQPEDAPCCGDRDPPNMGYQDVGGWIILGCILERWVGVMWTGLVWLRIGTGGELV